MIGENLCLTNLKQGSQSKENAGSSAKDHGVKDNTKAGNSLPNLTPDRGCSAISQFSSDAHKRAAMMLSYALTLGTEADWNNLTIVLMARLTNRERAALAYASLNSLSDDHAYLAASVALFGVLDGEVVQ